MRAEAMVFNRADYTKIFCTKSLNMERENQAGDGSKFTSLPHWDTLGCQGIFNASHGVFS